MEQSQKRTNRTVMALCAVLATVVLVSGCTHWGGSHGGHPSIWGDGGYGGCQLDYPVTVDRGDIETLDTELNSLNRTEVYDESSGSGDGAGSVGNDWIVVRSGSAE
mgnify:FL=1